MIKRKDILVKSIGQELKNVNELYQHYGNDKPANSPGI